MNAVMSQKPYTGIGMEGFIARWYASLTQNRWTSSKIRGPGSFPFFCSKSIWLIISKVTLWIARLADIVSLVINRGRLNIEAAGLRQIIGLAYAVQRILGSTGFLLVRFGGPTRPEARSEEGASRGPRVRSCRPPSANQFLDFSQFRRRYWARCGFSRRGTPSRMT